MTASGIRELEALAARYGGDDLGLTFARVAEHFERHTPRRLLRTTPSRREDAPLVLRSLVGGPIVLLVPVRVAVDELMALARRITAGMSR